MGSSRAQLPFKSILGEKRIEEDMNSTGRHEFHRDRSGLLPTLNFPASTSIFSPSKSMCYWSCHPRKWRTEYSCKWCFCKMTVKMHAVWPEAGLVETRKDMKLFGVRVGLTSWARQVWYNLIHIVCKKRALEQSLMPDLTWLSSHIKWARSLWNQFWEQHGRVGDLLPETLPRRLLFGNSTGRAPQRTCSGIT